MRDTEHVALHAWLLWFEEDVREETRWWKNGRKDCTGLAWLETGF